MTQRTISPSLASFDVLPDSALIDVNSFAILLGCSKNTVWRRVKAKKLPPPIKVSSQQTRWRIGDVRKSLALLVSSQGHS